MSLCIFQEFSDIKVTTTSLFHTLQKIKMNKKNINQSKNELGEHVLFEAVRQKNISYTRYILNMGGDVNKPNKHGRTCLMEAVLQKSYEMVEFLLTRYADPTSKTMCGDDAISYAIFSTEDQLCYDIVSLLLDKGANPYNQDINGNTNYFWAHVNKKTHICDLLEKRTSYYDTLDEMDF